MGMIKRFIIAHFPNFGNNFGKNCQKNILRYQNTVKFIRKENLEKFRNLRMFQTSV